MKPAIFCPAKDTLAVVELQHGERLEARWQDRSAAGLELISTGRRIVETSPANPGACEPEARKT